MGGARLVRLTAESSPWPIRPFGLAFPCLLTGISTTLTPALQGHGALSGLVMPSLFPPLLGFASASALNMLFSLLLLLTPLPISAQLSLPKRRFSNFSNELPSLKHTSQAPAAFPSWKHLHVVWYGCLITSVYLAEKIAPRGKNHVCLCAPLHFQGLQGS